MTTAEVSGNGDSNLRIGGGRIGGFGMTLDGTAVTVARPDAQVSWSQINSPSVEALTEFSVEAGGFKAETGHASGGTISFVSKSGTNDFHGDAYEFLRNQDLDARGFFAATKAIYKQNDFGVTVGGPVWLPKIYNGRNKSFFFFSYEGFRNRVGASSNPLYRAATGILDRRLAQLGELERKDDSDLRSVNHNSGERHLSEDAVSEQPDSAGAIRSDRESDHGVRAAACVQPNVPGLVPGTSAYVRNNADFLRHFPVSEQQVQHQGGPDDHLEAEDSGSFSAARGNRIWVAAPPPPTLPIPLSGNPGYNRSDVYRLSYDYTLSPTLLNRFYAGGNNWRQNHGAYTTFSGAPQSDGIPTTSVGWKTKGICVPNWPDCNLNFPIENFSDESTWGVGAPNGSDNIVVEFRDDLTKVHGSHTFKMGLLLQQHPLQRLRTDQHCRDGELLLSQHRDPAGHQPANRKLVRVLPAGPGVRLQPRYRAIYCRPVSYSPDVFSGRLARVVAPDPEPGPTV